MQWDEDTWEDITDPPSPAEVETRKSFKNCVTDGQQSGQTSVKEVRQNGHVSCEKPGHILSDIINSSEPWTLLSQTQQQKSEECIEDPSNVNGLQKRGQELLESYLTFTSITQNCAEFSSKDCNVKRYPETRPDGRLNGHQAYQALSSSKPKSFKAVRINSLSGTNSAKNRTNTLADTGHKVVCKNSRNRKDTHIQQCKQGLHNSHVDISTKVPHSLCKTKTYANQQQKKALQNNSSNKSSHSFHTHKENSLRFKSDCVSSSDTSEVSITEVSPASGYSLREYKREKVPSRQSVLARYSIFNNSSNYYHSKTKYPYGDAYDDEQEEKTKAIICVVFCVMGIGLIIGLVCLLSHYVEDRLIFRERVNKEDDKTIALMNEVYYRRTAEVIRVASQADARRSHNTWLQNILNVLNVLPNSALETLCDAIPQNLVGNTTEIVLNITLDIEDIISSNSDVMEGGEWKPTTCISRHRVAVIIPYRDRWDHLKVLLHYLIPILKRQQIHFRIFVVEQYGNETFNKGRIMNAAFREALKLFDFHCVTFHDVDLVPEDDRNMYSCTEQPKHMSHSIDKFHYILPYQGLVGGVLMFKREHFQLVNGYSNMYWGWGAEDDDMTTRILYHGLRIYRPPSNIAKYKMVKHQGRKSSEVAIRMRLLRSAAKRSKLEGLNNVKYTLMFTYIEKLFTHFIVDIGLP